MRDHPAPDTSATPAVEQPLPVPEPVQSIPDLGLRGRAMDAWRAASRLRRLIDQWRAWFHQLEMTNDADPGLALRMNEAVWACLQGLCDLGVNMPTFRHAEPKELLRRFPRPPDVSIGLDWQLDQEYRQATSEVLSDLDSDTLRPKSDGLGRLQSELLGFMQTLEITPNTAFCPLNLPINGSVYRPTESAEGAGAAHDQGRAGQAERSTPKRKRGRKADTNPKADKRVADAWRIGNYKTYADCAAALGGLTAKQVKGAIDRHRHRVAKRSKPPE